MGKLLSALHLLVTRAPHAPEAVYDRVADQYEAFRALWLRLAGGAVEQRMLRDLTRSLTPGCRVLDAGCGTGTLSRQMRVVEPSIQLKLLDLSPAMLAHTADIPGNKLVGSVMDLPFGDASFDVVVSSWGIETVPDPMRAVSEYLRVIRDAGAVLYTFCSLPDSFISRAGTAFLRTAVENRFAGRFLPLEETPWHDCGASQRVQSHSGLTTFVQLHKCCTVSAPILPAVSAPG